jgi:trypsin
MFCNTWNVKKATNIAILLLFSESLCHAQIRGGSHEEHMHHKKDNAMTMYHQNDNIFASQRHLHTGMHGKGKNWFLLSHGHHSHDGHDHGTRKKMKNNSERTKIPTIGKMSRKADMSPISNTHHDFHNRIIGGVSADADEFKFFASLDIGCGGSLIAPDFILTAAHCAGNINEVRIGSNEISTGGTVNSVVTECMHPNYDSFTTTNDFMLLKLSTPVDTNTYPIVKLNSDMAVPRVDQLLTVIGFGATSEGGSGSDSLLKVEVPANSHEECNRQYGGSIVEEVMFCAGFASGGKDSCQGDSGGPIVEVVYGVPTQIGVVSFGEGCARPDRSGVYSRVSGAYDWIQSTMVKLNQGDMSGCLGDSIGGSDDDSFPTLAPVPGLEPTVPISAPVPISSSFSPFAVSPTTDDDATSTDDDATPTDDDATPTDDNATPTDDNATSTDDDIIFWNL